MPPLLLIECLAVRGAFIKRVVLSTVLWTAATVWLYALVKEPGTPRFSSNTVEAAEGCSVKK